MLGGAGAHEVRLAEDADQKATGVDDGQAVNAMRVEECDGLLERRVFTDGDRGAVHEIADGPRCIGHRDASAGTSVGWRQVLLLQLPDGGCECYSADAYTVGVKAGGVDQEWRVRMYCARSKEEGSATLA